MACKAARSPRPQARSSAACSSPLVLTFLLPGRGHSAQEAPADLIRGSRGAPAAETGVISGNTRGCDPHMGATPKISLAALHLPMPDPGRASEGALRLPRDHR